MIKVRPDLQASAAARASRAKGSPEAQIAKAVADYLKLALRDDECLWWAVPNGEYRHPKTAARLKSHGVRAGVPDLAFILPGGGAAFIELKADRGVLSPQQKAFCRDATAKGAKWALCRSVEDVDATLRKWGVVPRATLFNNSICVRFE